MTALQSEAILARIADRSASRIELDLERLPTLLERLGRPHLRLPRVIHIAGTNGKGSTLAFLRAMLRHAGKRVQCFTSPYLLRVTEEIELADGEIADDRLAGLLTRVDEASDGIGPTSFEALAAAAFLAFAEDDADVLLMETAMGGRLDVTNVVPDPALTVITPIALDHQAFLGDTIAKIAGEKAGILKLGAPCVANPEHPDAVEVIERRAAELGIELDLLPPEADHDLPPLGLAGPHQQRNAALAVAAMRRFAPELLPDALAGLVEARWPARMQRLDRDDVEIWIDGGHNPHAARAMSAAIAALPPKPLVMIVGMLDNRPVGEFLSAFRSFEPLVIGVPLPGQPVYSVGRPMAPEVIAAAAHDLGLNALVAGSPAEALEQMPGAWEETRILVTGSLYLAGRAAEELSRSD
ncbi:MAG: bifunctional folylpolyglutamate synthase/dihydrofolate synthase [Minwuia sp.]|uniref:bifunctional folylpolyglutamate synthase/dihydrofolate synthase n=1 Tax=Minwuia sp. TaxID=2493630 RepID=UPI003A877E1C